MKNNTGGKIWPAFLAAMFLLLGANHHALAECHHATAPVEAAKSCCPVQAECNCEPAVATHADSHSAAQISIFANAGGCPCELKSAPIEPEPAVVTPVSDFHIDLPISAVTYRATGATAVLPAQKTSGPSRGSPPRNAPPRAPPVLS